LDQWGRARGEDRSIAGDLQGLAWRKDVGGYKAVGGNNSHRFHIALVAGNGVNRITGCYRVGGRVRAKSTRTGESVTGLGYLEHHSG